MARERLELAERFEVGTKTKRMALGASGVQAQSVEMREAGIRLEKRGDGMTSMHSPCCAVLVVECTLPSCSRADGGDGDEIKDGDSGVDSRQLGIEDVEGGEASNKLGGGRKGGGVDGVEAGPASIGRTRLPSRLRAPLVTALSRLERAAAT